MNKDKPKASPAMSNAHVQMILPKINKLHAIGPAVLRVTYVNLGKHRVSSEIVGYRHKDEIILVDSGSRMAWDDFLAYARGRWPMEHEKGRNPNNVTLGVQSGGSFNATAFKN
jgi:hypothetical protein